MQCTHMKCFAAMRKSNTDPDVTPTAIMLSALRIAVENTIGKRPAACQPVKSRLSRNSAREGKS